MILIIINKNYLLAFFVFIILCITINAQEEKEKIYNELKQQLMLEGHKLDSLNLTLTQKINLINIEKSKADSNKDKIQELLSSTANLTNSIDNTQLRINELDERFSLVKADLYVIYSQKIDSVNQSNLSKEVKNKKTIELIEKRLLISPKIDFLSFQPEKALNIPSSEDSVEQKIYKEYLTSALLEVKNKLTRIEELKLEIENIITLSEELSLFLEEVEFDSDIYSYTSQNKNMVFGTDAKYSPEVSASHDNTLRTQTDSFSKILNQLKLNSEIKGKIYSLSNTSQKNNLNEFKELISQVERQLSDYKTVISNKLTKL